MLLNQTAPKVHSLNGQGQQKDYCHCNFIELRYKDFKRVAEHPTRYVYQTQELSTDLLPLTVKIFIKASLTSFLKQAYCVVIHHKKKTSIKVYDQRLNQAITAIIFQAAQTSCSDGPSLLMLIQSPVLFLAHYWFSFTFH